MTAVANATPDLTALLSQVRMLEGDRERLVKELEAAKIRVEEEHRRLEETNAKMGRLTEGKRAEMQPAAQDLGLDRPVGVLDAHGALWKRD